MALNMHKEELDSIINEYISEIKKILGADLKRAVIVIWMNFLLP